HLTRPAVLMEARYPRIELGLARLRPVLPVAVIAGIISILPLPKTCLCRIFLDIPCPGCGLTRAAFAMARLDLASAMRLNPLSPALVAVTAVTFALAFVLGDAAWRRLV